nr:zinc metalloprotease HtpX [candidate division KSB1 bacterium]NIR71498.1 zinc metalloprotease HtpX [candidate division KSB1 bacterium]NIS23419.1 zinc metalloprotease HtpX [candidate division KSB1 bacterium]NIT70313.1 zinc metalloprotease HtpX [candidate division KSB1 bacterium]NIU24037.1 zinc metalloprotease HtpX [candidate division KSB1 bacterium]
GMNFFSYWYSDKMILKMYRAQEVTEAQAPQLYTMVRRLAQRARLPMPKLYVIPTDTPNAFATGRDPEHAAVAVTDGIMRTLNEEELEGVISHELAHVKHRDILIGSIAATIAGAINMLYYFGLFFGGGDDDEGNPIVSLLMLIIAPIAAMLIQMAISRSREYAADRGGAEICGKPLALASALENLERGVARRPMQANPTSAHMFIVNPLRGGGLSSMFSTHPSTQERVRRLREMAGTRI